MKDLEELEVWNFPDGHKHLVLKEDELNLTEIGVSIKSFDDIFLLNQLKGLCPNFQKLRINYLLGARCDRSFGVGQYEDLKIIAWGINHLYLDEVEILKPHSKRSLELIGNSKEITVTDRLLQQCILDNNLVDYSIISPDKGASEWITRELGTGGVIQCNKIREGGVVKSVTFEGEVKEVSIIVDDLCDGGATFIELAQELKAKGAREIYLIVTHGVFSKGYDNLKQCIKHIYCTNSFKSNDYPKFITEYKVR